MDYDPFFAVGTDSNWNACIGQQGYEENYVDGYIEAAIELVDAIFEKKLYDKRDTLVLPILYNARHAIELALKMAIGELACMGVIGERLPMNHNILAHWKFLAEARLGDELFRQLVVELEPFVISLSKIDKDGQEFRYHETREGNQSLKGHAVTSLITIRESLYSLHCVLKKMKRRLYGLRDEHHGGLFTHDLSRRDLIEIAKMLPAKSLWDMPVFNDVKGALRNRYGIGSRKFSAALKLIQENRVTKALIDVESDLIYLTDEKAKLLANKHLDLCPPSQGGSKSQEISHPFPDIEDLLQEGNREAPIYQELLSLLTIEEVADVRVIFDLGRNSELPEGYETSLGAELEGLKSSDKVDVEFVHVFSKVNFRSEFIKGLEALGKVRLAQSLFTLNAID